MPKGSIKVHARSYEWLATSSTTLRYPPPLADRAPNPPAFEFWWKMLEFVFALPNPTTFPPLATPPTARDAAVLSRYLKMADEMAESETLSSDAEVKVHIPDDGAQGVERLERNDFPSKESTRGFTTLFRQLDSHREPAGFNKAQRALRHADAAAPDDRSDERLAQLSAWGKARGCLCGTNLKVLVGQRLRDQGRMPGAIPGEEGLSPQQLISAYQYGDLIHWSDDSKLVAVASDPFLQEWQEMEFLVAVTGLIHLYLGFSLLVQAALSD